jgi:hypothetical protein
MAIITPQTGSIIGSTTNPDQNTTRVALSTNIVIKVNGQPVGAIQSMTVNETRSISPIDEVGFDGHIDMSPTKSTDIEGSCKRIRYDRLRMLEAFSRGYIHVHSQRIPFDIEIIDTYSSGDDTNYLITTIKNVWVKSVSYNYEVSNYVISEDMQWSAEAIYSTVNNSNAANGGERGLPLQINTTEREADRGLRRGALDVPNLIKAAF